MPHLIVREPGCVSYSIPLDGALRAGRQEDNELVLGDPRVSRHHIEISSSGAGYVVRDLGSTHGMLINGQKSERHRLGDGDRIQIGSALLTFRADDDPSASIEFERTDPSLPTTTDPADRRLRLFYAISDAIGSARDGEEIVSRMVVALREVLGCERAIVGLGQNPRDGIRKIARSASPADDVVVSRSILEAVLTRRERVVFIEKNSKKAPPTMIRERIRAAVCIPLVAGSRVFGFLYVDDRRDTHKFAHEDVDFLTALAHLAAGALDSAERLKQADARAEALSGMRARYEIVGSSPPMARLQHAIEKCGPTGAHVLIHGESGTGKELVARALHAASPRAASPLVAVNCAAIPDSMIESELFGYVRGAFTGAVQDKKGKFVLANKSTLFLDEIGDLSLAAQAKVLRAIQEGEIQPLGSERVLRVDVRIVGATHKNLRKEIAEKRFREDLFYRLGVVELEVPPLRDRGDDVVLLAQTLLESVGINVGKRLSGITPQALAALRRYGWPGNVRELLNELERAAIFTETSTIDSGDLSARVRATEPLEETGRSGSLASRFAALDSTEKKLIEEALEKAEGNVSEAARLLGITWIMLKRRMERFGLA